jgi:hypothetical protein
MPIEHIDIKELELFIHEKLPPSRAERIRAHVRVCTECEERLVSGLLSQISTIRTAHATGQPLERRASKRLPRTGTGYVQSLCPLSFDRVAAEIIDGSDEGFGLCAGTSLDIGALVQICVDEVMVLGDVRSCRPTEDGRFRLGVHIDYAKQHRARTARA